jgi:wyosine [tRNA(Phe)-imidazoG37] synthetase (radical SAM superfamily)
LYKPSFDAATEEAFLKDNRPHPSLNLNIMNEVLIKFSEEYKAKNYLNTAVKDVKDNEKELRAIRQ